MQVKRGVLRFLTDLQGNFPERMSQKAGKFLVFESTEETGRSASEFAVFSLTGVSENQLSNKYIYLLWVATS